jgi:hypothetical protein
MASERETEINIRRCLVEVGIHGPLLEQAVRSILGQAYQPQPEPKKRRCGASQPHEKGEDGWMYCVLPSGHTQPHTDYELWWQDGDVVEVTTVEEIRAVPDHVHDFVGDEDTCVREQGCQLTWGERMAQDREWGNES